MIFRFRSNMNNQESYEIHSQIIFFSMTFCVVKHHSSTILYFIYSSSVLFYFISILLRVWIDPLDEHTQFYSVLFLAFCFISFSSLIVNATRNTCFRFLWMLISGSGGWQHVIIILWPRAEQIWIGYIKRWCVFCVTHKVVNMKEFRRVKVRARTGRASETKPARSERDGQEARKT